MRNLLPVFISSALALAAVMADDEERPTAAGNVTIKSLDRDSDQLLSKAQAVANPTLSDHLQRLIQTQKAISVREHRDQTPDIQSPQ